MNKAWRNTGVAAAAWGLAAAAQAAVGAGAFGSCGKGVGGALDDIPSFTVTCPGGFWADVRPGARSTASWSGSASHGVYRASASVAIDTTPLLGSTLALGRPGGANRQRQLAHVAPAVEYG